MFHVLTKPRMGVFIVALALMAGHNASPALAGPTPDKVIKEAEASSIAARDLNSIREVINNQLAAFAADDAEAAFAHASPIIQRRFGNADRFIAMVKSGYAPLLRPRMVSFDDAKKGDGEREIIQPVTLLAPSGILMTALYRMVEVSGEWRIAGCALVKSPDRAL